MENEPASGTKNQNWLFQYLKRLFSDAFALDQRLSWQKKLVCVAIGLVLIFVLPNLATYFVTQMLDDLGKTAMLTVNLAPLAQESDGYALPIQVINKGEIGMKINSIQIESCYNVVPVMLDQLNQDLVVGGEYQIALDSPRIIDQMTKKSCFESQNFLSQSCVFQPYLVNSTTMMVAPTDCTAYSCGECEFSISISTDHGNFTVQKEVYGPLPIPLTLYSTNYLPGKPHAGEMGNIGMQFFSPREMCEYNLTCPAVNPPEDISTNSWLTISANLTLHLVANNSSPGLENVGPVNISIKPRYPN